MYKKSQRNNESQDNSGSIPFNSIRDFKSIDFIQTEIPKDILLSKTISNDAKVLCSFLINMLKTKAEENNWVDTNGDIYINYSLLEVMQDLNVGKDKAIKLMNELDFQSGGAGLFRKVKPGQGKPARIYINAYFFEILSVEQRVINGDSQSITSAGRRIEIVDKKVYQNNDYRGASKQNSRSRIIRSLESRRLESRSLEVENANDTSGINDDNNIISINNINNNIINLISDQINHLSGCDLLLMQGKYESIIKHNIDYDTLVRDYDTGFVDDVISCILDALFSPAKFLRINRQEMPAAIVKSKLININYDHVKYVYENMEVCRSHIKDPSRYILTALYKAAIGYNIHSKAYFDSTYDLGLEKIAKS